MLNQIKEHIERCDIVLVFAGAGMSADSNLPTYRDEDGFWNDYPLYRELEKDYVSMMSPQGLLCDPYFAWGFFFHQYNLYSHAKPHKGYEALLALCQAKKDFFVVTTNVDGLFLQAGFPDEKLHEAHGTIHRLQCSIPCHHNVWGIEDLKVEVDYTNMRAKDTLPLCKNCGAVARPNIFMFGDTIESYVDLPSQKSAKRFRDFRKIYKNEKVLIFEIGIGAKGMKEHIKNYKKMFHEVVHVCINPRVDDCDENGIYVLSVGAEEGLYILVK